MNLFTQVNTLFDLPMRICIIALASKNLQVINNRTTPATIVFVILHRGTGPQPTIRRRALELNMRVAYPIQGPVVRRAIAHHHPVVSAIPHAVVSEAGYLVLITERRAYAVGVQIGPGLQVHQSYNLTAFDGRPRNARPPVGLVSLADVPQTGYRRHILDGGNELLAASRLELTLLGRQQEFRAGFDVR